MGQFHEERYGADDDGFGHSMLRAKLGIKWNRLSLNQQAVQGFVLIVVSLSLIEYHGLGVKVYRNMVGTFQLR